jgi:hypothetical protein
MAHKVIFGSILEMESWLTFLVADKMSILSNLGCNGSLITKMLSYFRTSVAPVRRGIATKKHAQLLTLEIIVPGRKIRLTVEAYILLFTLVTFKSRNNLVTIRDGNASSGRRIRSG